jgi:hypothetical protein
VGVSTNSTPVKVTIQPPGAPSISARVGASNQVDVFLSSSSFFISQEQDGFKVERASDAQGSPGTWAEIGTLWASNYYAATFTDSNVVAHTTNWYRARAFNALGNSEYSTPTKVEIVPPPAPYALIIDRFRDRVNLRWYGSYTANLDGYQIDRAPDEAGSPGAWSQIKVVSASHPYLEDTLTVGTHWYRVRAFNWVGASSNGVPASVTIGALRTPNCVARVGMSNRVDVTVRAEYPFEQDGFWVQRASDAQGEPGDWLDVGTIVASNIYSGTFADTNVTANTTNWYRARAFSALGNSTNGPAYRQEIVPPRPPEFVRAIPNEDVAELAWFDFYEGHVDGFQVERAPDMAGAPGQWNLVATIPGSGISPEVYYHDDFGLSAGIYWYRVRSFNWVGESTNSVHVSITITPATLSTPARVVALQPLITSILPTSSNVMITFWAPAGATNFVEATHSLTEPFSPISPAIVVPGTGLMETNFNDPESVESYPAKFYRIRSD